MRMVVRQGIRRIVTGLLVYLFLETRFKSVLAGAQAAGMEKKRNWKVASWSYGEPLRTFNYFGGVRTG